MVPVRNSWEPFAGELPSDAIASVYATREQVESVGLAASRRFVVLRDPRDTLVSAYFSFRDTHKASPMIQPLREQLTRRGFEDGMVYLMGVFMPRVFAIHESWRDEPYIRYEDLLDADFRILRRTFRRIGLAVDDEQLKSAVRANRFRRRTGRERGDEAREHLRKGVAGDWRNHFTDRIATEYAARFGNLHYDAASAAPREASSDLGSLSPRIER